MNVNGAHEHTAKEANVISGPFCWIYCKVI